MTSRFPTLALTLLWVLSCSGQGAPSPTRDQSGHQRGHIRDITFVGWSRDSSLVLSFSAGDGGLRLWDARTGRLIADAEFDRKTTQLTAVAGPQLKAVLLPSGALEVQDSEGVNRWLIANDRSVKSATSGNGRLIAEVADLEGGIAIRNAADGAVVLRLEGHPGVVRSVAFSPDGQQIASANGDRTVHVRAVETGRLLTVLRGHTAAVNAVAFSPDSRVIVSGGADGTVRSWDVQTGMLRATLTGHGKAVRSVAFASPAELVSGSDDRSVKVWELAAGRLSESIEIPGWRGSARQRTCCGSPVAAVRPNPSGRVIAIGCVDGYTYLWDRDSRVLTQIAIAPAGSDSVYEIRFQADGHPAWTIGGEDGLISLNRIGGSLDYAATRPPANIQSVSAVAVTPDGRLWIAATAFGLIRVFDRDWSRESKRLPTTHRVLAIAVSTDGQFVAAGGEDQSVQVWFLSSGARRWAAHDLGKLPN